MSVMAFAFSHHCRSRCVSSQTFVNKSCTVLQVRRCEMIDRLTTGVGRLVRFNVPLDTLPGHFGDDGVTAASARIVAAVSAENCLKKTYVASSVSTCWPLRTHYHAKSA